MNSSNVKLVRDVIAGVDDSRFTMADWNTGGARLMHTCGTAACIGGWTEALFPDFDLSAEALGLSPQQGDDLFCPEGYWREDDPRYTRQNAVETLDFLLEFGVVDWARQVLIVAPNGMYWNAPEQGTTRDRDEAHIYTWAEAKKQCVGAAARIEAYVR